MLSKPDFLEATRRYKNKKLNAHERQRPIRNWALATSTVWSRNAWNSIWRVGWSGWATKLSSSPSAL